MTEHDLPEVTACAEASKLNHYVYGGEKGDRPCRYEACHPQGCGSTLSINHPELDDATAETTVPSPPAEEKAESA
eukprot:15180615-Ditylum_brightwellii.AAC.1